MRVYIHTYIYPNGFKVTNYIFLCQKFGNAVAAAEYEVGKKTVLVNAEDNTPITSIAFSSIDSTSGGSAGSSAGAEECF